jgi:hypothetical protein
MDDGESSRRRRRPMRRPVQRCRCCAELA